MKRASLIVMVLIVVAATVAYAQGRGSGNLRAGQPCPYGYTQPNSSPGGWWTRANPTTPQQKEFVNKVSSLHNAIRDKQIEIAQLRNSQGDQREIASLEKDIQGQRTKLHEYMLKNREIRQQIGPVGPNAGYGGNQRSAGQWQRGCSGGPQGVQQRGMGMGAGMGMGMRTGMGMRMGMKPNCPRR